MNEKLDVYTVSQGMPSVHIRVTLSCYAYGHYGHNIMELSSLKDACTAVHILFISY